MLSFTLILHHSSIFHTEGQRDVGAEERVVSFQWPPLTQWKASMWDREGEKREGEKSRKGLRGQ